MGVKIALKLVLSTGQHIEFLILRDNCGFEIRIRCYKSFKTYQLQQLNFHVDLQSKTELIERRISQDVLEFDLDWWVELYFKLMPLIVLADSEINPVFQDSIRILFNRINLIIFHGSVDSDSTGDRHEILKNLNRLREWAIGDFREVLSNQLEGKNSQVIFDLVDIKLDDQAVIPWQIGMSKTFFIWFIKVHKFDSLREIKILKLAIGSALDKHGFSEELAIVEAMVFLIS